MSNLGGGLKTIDWRSQTLETFEKNFYVEDRRVSDRSDSEIDAFRRAKEIRVRLLCVCMRDRVLTSLGPRQRRAPSSYQF